MPDREVYQRAFELCVGMNISFADAFNAASMEARGIAAIDSWDTDFDRIAGLQRVEPENGGSE